jgi:hypothetical protein
LVLDEEECAQVRSQLSKYISEHGVFGSLHATQDQDRLSSIEWWNMYGSSTTHLHKLVVRVLSQVVNTSFAERCWSNLHPQRRPGKTLGSCAVCTTIEVVVPLL